MRKSFKLFTISIFGVVITSCSTTETLRTVYEGYQTYKATKETVKGYENLKNISSITKIEPIFYPYRSIKIEVKLKNVKGRDNEKLTYALKENIKFNLKNFFREYELNDKQICETQCKEPTLIIRFKERSYKSLLQKWALKGKYGGTIEYVDAKTNKVILKDKIGNKETFYDIARTIGQILELKAFKSGLEKYKNNKENANEFIEKHKNYLQNKKNEKFVNPRFEKLLKDS